MFENLFSKGGLTLDRLRSFMQMAQAGSIAKAAPYDTNRQSQISRQIRELEQFFGTELTRRRGKTLSLSPAGERLATLIQEQLQDLEDFRREQSGQAKSFTIGTGASVLEWLVMPALPQIATLLGGANLSVVPYRSRNLAAAIHEGVVDFAVVRQDALGPHARVEKLMRLGFVLCIPKKLMKKGTRDASQPSLWQTLPFAAGRDGGQMDTSLRNAMAEAGVDFRPQFECGSMLQVRQLVEMGACAAVLPEIGVRGLDEKEILITPFAPMRNYGRSLVLHWNERQMRRRGLELSQIRAVARLLKSPAVQ
ncbi:LysR family transcriptional regulator [Prosthecobacter dejongeii]|uniref:DNA-binding transcriptional LysR family regulator n=1 Tax=Prosthecobacter dejongeii TaxID=48465 RepID=A0A7W8DPU7_9BACT|nr:LysR family transcriptional regulator [Prosthecobacter dejongeii]MBB5037788.1 DNA-binding transcriptional LysR family regulator [Prosthecobacter dejongeii]